EEVRADYGSTTTIPWFNKNAKFKIGNEILKIPQDNAFHGTNGDDVVDHTEKVLAILELIKIPNVDPNQLRLHVFLLLLTGAARKWWIDEIKGGDDEVLMEDIVPSDDEWKESDNTNHLNDNSDLFFKPYLDVQEGNNICTFEKGRECFDEHKPNIYGRNVSELDDISISNDREKQLLNEGVCKSEKFKVIRYSIGTNEEYIGINISENDTWERTNGIVSSFYHEIFCKKYQGWLVKRTK
ncbi:hypothetical protein Tco_1347678, partial [Tanacetum coccineum]